MDAQFVVTHSGRVGDHKLRVHAVESCIATARQRQHPAEKIRRSRAFHMSRGNHAGCPLLCS